MRPRPRNLNSVLFCRRLEQAIAPVLELCGRDDASLRAAAVEAQAIVLKRMRVRIAGHRAMPFGRRMAMPHHHAPEPAAPFQERLVDPCPMIAAEFREGCGE